MTIQSWQCVHKFVDACSYILRSLLLSQVDIRNACSLLLSQVDIRNACSPEFVSSQAYQDQVNVSDILVGTKTDLADEDQVGTFQEFASELFPPKSKAGHAPLSISLQPQVSLGFDSPMKGPECS